MDADHGASTPSRVDAVLGARPVAAVAAALTHSRLRVLAYHDVPDQDAFARQVELIHAAWNPVSGTQVADALHGGVPLPDRPVWITFDDGRPDVVSNGLPVLEAFGFPATLYVCPSVIETGDPFWWQAIEARPHRSHELAGTARSGRDLVRALKQIDDAERRAIVAAVTSDEPTHPLPAQMDRAALDAWISSGREVGNHTWDHPILDRCTPAEQVEQIDRAHGWLSEVLGAPPDLFAYPNGDRTEVVASQLFRLGYRSAPLFDHRLASKHPKPDALSRVRIDANVSVDRARALLSGSHTGLFHLAQRVRRRRPSRPTAA